MSYDFTDIPTDALGAYPISEAPVDDRVAQRSSQPSGEPELKTGKGLDVGTVNLLSAAMTEDGETAIRRERNMFLEIPSDLKKHRTMLTKLNVPYVSYQGRVFVIGDASFDVANMFGREVRRPMRDGFLSPDERDAIPMLRFIVERLLGAADVENQPVHYCIPAPSVDTHNDTVYHEGVLGSVLKKLGYAPKAINEAHAVVYSELADKDFTGVGISCGGGMFNVCVAYKSIPGVMFSVSRGGDWVDQHVAKVMGIPRTQATNIKESGGVRLTEPRNREEEAIVLYYRNLVDYVLTNFAERLAYAKDAPRFTEPVDVVLAGGTSLVSGFVEIFSEELQKMDFPLRIGNVRRAEDPLTSVVRGCLIAAALEQD